MTLFFLSALFVVMTAIVYCEVLLMQGMILESWDKFLHEHIKKQWLLKILGDCVYCFGGQLALWSYPVIFWHSYQWIFHFCFIMTVIFTIHIYKLIWN